MALSGKIALVTGAAQGLGKGFSDILLKNGAKVALLDLSETIGKITKEDFDKEYGKDRSAFFTCDVTSDERLKEAFQKTTERFGRIDIVSNNAGIVDETNWKKMVAVNLNAVIQGTYLALEHMKKENGGEGGVIINTASAAALGPLITAPVYTATKHGVIGFTRAMAGASQAGGYGVRVSALCPSFVKTPLLENQSNEMFGQFAHLLHVVQENKKFGMLTVPEVAERFLQLVTEEDTNGAVMMVKEDGAAYVNFKKD